MKIKFFWVPLLLLTLHAGQAQAQDSTLLGSFLERIFPRPAARPRPAPGPRATPSPRPVVHNDYFSVQLGKMLTSLESISGTTGQSPDADPACVTTFAPINQKNYHRIVIGFGYSDTAPKPLVYDALARAALQRQLVARCNPGQELLCGYQLINPKDPNNLRKRLANSDGRTFRTVDIRLIYGSLSYDHRKNIAPTNLVTQMSTCLSAEAAFNEEIANGADTVIYFGHARNGGGPDFCPPVLTADGQHVDYPHYQKERRGINGVTKAIRVARLAKKRSSLIAIIGCSTQLHFRRRILNAAWDQGIILTDRTIDFSHVWHDTLGVLAASIGQSCREPLEDYLGEGSSHGINGASRLTNYLR